MTSLGYSHFLDNELLLSFCRVTDSYGSRSWHRDRAECGLTEEEMRQARDGWMSQSLCVLLYQSLCHELTCKTELYSGHCSATDQEQTFSSHTKAGMLDMQSKQDQSFTQHYNRDDFVNIDAW